MSLRSMREIKELYDRGVNVMRLFRERESSDSNSLHAIQAAYDLQAGSYVQLLAEPDHARFVQEYTAAVAGILDRYSPASVMEAAVGEATTLVNVLRQMQHRPAHALGFDISWSRIAVAREFSREHGVESRLFTAGLSEIPMEDDAVDVVFTSHSIEPNRGREAEILRELFRVTRRYLVLLEPSNELGSEATRERIEEHKYCLDLYRHARELGLDVIEHRLFDHIRNPRNETALIVISKETKSAPYTGGFFACPACHRSLVLHKGNYFCGECLVVYPVVAGIPCLSSAQGMIATRYLEMA